MLLLKNLSYTARLAFASFVFVSSMILSTSTNAQEATTDKYIGALLPITGQYKHLGEMVQNSFEMAWYDYAPKDFHLSLFDTESDNSGARNAYTRATENNLQLIVGPLTRRSTSTVRNNFNSNTTILSLSNDASNAQGGLYTLGYTPESQGAAIAQILEKQNFERAILFVPDNDYGNRVASGIGMLNTGRIVHTIYYPSLSPDLSTQVKYLVNNKEYYQYDVIILPDGNPQTIRLLAGQLAYYDAQDPYMKTDSEQKKIKKNVDVKKQIPMIGGLGFHALNGAYKEPPLLNGYYIRIPHTTRKADFDKRYQDLYKKKPTPIARLAYDSMALAIISMNTDNYKQKLQQEDGFSGISGIIKMDDYGTVMRQFQVMKIGRTNSKFQYNVTVPSR